MPRQTKSRNVEYFDLFFTGVGGAQIGAKYLRPRSVQKPHPAVVVFHGYSGQSGDFWNYRGWVAEGFSVAAMNCQHLAPRIRADVLMFTGLMDTCCPPSTQFAAYNKIQSNKEVLIYPDYGHEGLPRSSADRILDFMCEL